jgi:hypothetical protein
LARPATQVVRSGSQTQSRLGLAVTRIDPPTRKSLDALAAEGDLALIKTTP